ncbi:hypothetical protein PUNSTDRAFT_136988 [Punctularia strigosozonata HHB-11173 SS5]|uniref:uncharacterized protein n=1 Tax=Punctularia strigosozonata (strain HHB-11173) TaxID=741275 RepID=UPI0004417968|nr:uncharacterized protein PUNSTDRAFT_136988 [Punctularia strigosozonata HHB-11173 SS5]EIN06201.1 hypothetical protein PUNSTDRAFT_136988 [Punctularia strigosozonata HHB-11173 SS5]
MANDTWTHQSREHNPGERTDVSNSLDLSGSTLIGSAPVEYDLANIKSELHGLGQHDAGEHGERTTLTPALDERWRHREDRDARPERKRKRKHTRQKVTQVVSVVDTRICARRRGRFFIRQNSPVPRSPSHEVKVEEDAGFLLADPVDVRRAPTVDIPSKLEKLVDQSRTSSPPRLAIDDVLRILADVQVDDSVVFKLGAMFLGKRFSMLGSLDAV